MVRRKTSYDANAVVTGAGSGIGRAFALELAARGSRVVCADINLIAAQETIDLMPSGTGMAVPCDVSDVVQVQALATQAQVFFSQSATPGITLMINNAGVGTGGKPVGDIPLDDWQWTLGVNLWGVIHGCHVFTPLLKQQAANKLPCGLINVASTASFAAAPLMGPYNVSKAAALALTETLSAELAGTGIQVTALCPTFVKTNIARDGRIDPASSRLAQRLMAWTGREASEVARTTLNAMDKGQLYVLPQIDARMIWRMKRLIPHTYTRGAGALSRLAKWAL